jgi:hypothetical protein
LVLFTTKGMTPRTTRRMIPDLILSCGQKADPRRLAGRRLICSGDTSMRDRRHSPGALKRRQYVDDGQIDAAPPG